MGFLEGCDFEPNAIEQKKRSIKAQGRPIIDLTSGNPTVHGFLFPLTVLERAALSALRKTQYEPDPQGVLEARESLSAFYQHRLSPEHLILTASTSEAYRMLFSLLCEPGDNLLVPDITYPLFEFFAADARVELNRYHLDPENQWQPDPRSIRADEHTRGAILVSPNNPTGSVTRDLSPFAALNLPLIVDEVFAEFSEGAMLHLQAWHSQLPVFSLNGLSKMLALPNLKLGWIALNPSARELYYERLLFLNDTYLSASYLVQGMVPTLLSEGEGFRLEYAAKIRRNRNIACEIAKDSEMIEALRPEGGASIICRSAFPVDEEEVVLELLDRGVDVAPGYFFGFGQSTVSYFVLSLVATEEDLCFGLSTLEKVLQSTTRL